jgi:hypothetical protein
MNRLVLLCGALLLFAGIASAQDEAPKVEVFGGYSYLRVNPGGNAPGLNFNGGSGSFAYNLTPMFGVVGDFGGYHWSQGVVDANAISYLFGPKIALRHGPITPFAQVLFGGAHLSASGNCDSARVRSETTVFGGCAGSINGFAMTLGGGLDWNATNHLGIRVVQAEYLLTRFTVGNISQTMNNARISTGVVFRW